MCIIVLLYQIFNTFDLNIDLDIIIKYNLIIKEKEDFIMKSQKKIFTTAIKTIAEKSLERNANSTSCIIYYQPEVPSALKKFIKIDNDK